MNMKLRCKKDFLGQYNEKNLIKDTQYKVHMDLKEFVIIEHDEWFYRFEKKRNINAAYSYLYEYFYTSQEERLLKMKELWK